MTATVTAFKWVPPFAQGFVRDLRIRWAHEEAGLPYDVELIGLETTASDAYRQWQPFGQVPAYRDEAVEIFESGARPARPSSSPWPTSWKPSARTRRAKARPDRPAAGHSIHKELA